MAQALESKTINGAPSLRPDIMGAIKYFDAQVVPAIHYLLLVQLRVTAPLLQRELVLNHLFATANESLALMQIYERKIYFD